MYYKEKTSKTMVCLIILGDLICMNILLAAIYAVWPTFNTGSVFSGRYWEMAVFNTLCYAISAYYNGVVLHHRKKRNLKIIGKVTKNCLMFASISVAFIALAGYEAISTRFMILFHVSNYFLLIFWRISCYHALRKFRQHGRNSLSCIFIGSSKNIRELYKEMTEPTLGYKIMGYFDYKANEELSKSMIYLGTPNETVEWMKRHKPDNVFCGLHSSESELILPIIHWCEQNFTHFFNVPDVRSYLHRKMWFESVGDVPVLSLHREPLNKFDNRLVKRIFDVLMSGLFLCTAFPIIYIIVGSIIKITSPGPIFFKQKRNGINGKEFWCYKFRSMKVNKDADKVQATKNDPRKTKFGDFMRKTNIDELPQLINVFKGDMSLVGPRPHMLKHTEEYSALIDNYMVRHWVKPGITGWAQVTGFRGETKELYQMEGRVEADIWYMEHWSFLLDLFIIYKTFANVIKGEKEAY